MFYLTLLAPWLVFVVPMFLFAFWQEEIEGTGSRE